MPAVQLFWMCFLLEVIDSKMTQAPTGIVLQKFGALERYDLTCDDQCRCYYSRCRD